MNCLKIMLRTRNFNTILNNNNLAYLIRTSKSYQTNFIQQKIKQKNEQQFKHLYQQQIDNKTQNVLIQYENQIKIIKQHHFKIQQQIKQRSQQKLKKAQFSQDQQIDQIKFNRMQQFLSNKQILTTKIHNLSTKFKPKFIFQRKNYELQYLKKYMLQNISQVKQQKQTNKSILQQLMKEQTNFNNKSYIPNGLILKKLHFKTKQNKQKQILLAGVQQKNEQHCVYIKHLTQRLKIKNCITLLSPDLPIFIKSQQSFLQQWRQFLQKPSYSTKFYLNPNPKTVKDIRISKQYIRLILHSMTKSKSFYQTTYSIMKLNQSTVNQNYKYQHQPLLSGFKSSSIQNIYFCDYPFIKERQMIAINVKLQDLRQLIKQYTYFKKIKKENYSAELLLPKNVIQQKFKYIMKVAKHIAMVNQNEKAPILICPSQISQLLSQQWSLSNNTQQQELSYNHHQHQYLLDIDLNLHNKQVLFIQFIQKLVILDLIMTPLIQNYFIKNTIGGKQNLGKVFMVWNHYHQLYKKAMNGDTKLKEESMTP